MDLEILYFFNQTLAHPLLDLLMVALSTLGLALLPGAGIVLISIPKQQRIGLAILSALIIGIAATLALIEESLQSFSPVRSVDPGDFMSDVAGMIFFWALSDHFVQSTPLISLKAE